MEQQLIEIAALLEQAAVRIRDLAGHAPDQSAQVDFVSVKEACAISGLTDFAIRGMLRDGVIRGVKVGKSVKVSTASLAALAGR